jgi:hypothetical protein
MNIRKPPPAPETLPATAPFFKPRSKTSSTEVFEIRSEVRRFACQERLRTSATSWMFPPNSACFMSIASDLSWCIAASVPASLVATDLTWSWMMAEARAWPVKQTSKDASNSHR